MDFALLLRLNLGLFSVHSFDEADGDGHCLKAALLWHVCLSLSLDTGNFCLFFPPTFWQVFLSDPDTIQLDRNSQFANRN